MADGVDEIRAALAFTKKENLRMVLLGGQDAWRVAPELAKAKVPVIYTGILDITERDFEGYDAYFRAPAVLAAAGVPVALSSGGQAANVRYLSDLGGRARAYGLSDLASLQAITLRPAEILGIADRLGSLTPGKDATFFLADGDILDTRTHVLRAWVMGRESDLEDRQKKLWEKYRNRPRRP
jgi:imidazolonepropionase-like amidohydrolase